MRLIFPTLVLWIGCTTSLAARDIFVNNLQGDDRRQGSSAVPQGVGEGPVRTIARALRLARPSDRIVLAKTAEPYRESVTLSGARHSGAPGDPFVIDGGGAILDGTKDIPGDAWKHFRKNVFRYRPTHLSHQQIFFEGKPATRLPVARDANEPPGLKPLQWSLLRGHVYFRVEEGRLPHQYPLSQTGLPTGITLYQVHHVIVSDLVVLGCQLDGVNAQDGVSDTACVGVVCAGNGRSGFSANGASRLRLVQCQALDNGVAQVRGDGYSHTELIGCKLMDNSAPETQKGKHAEIRRTDSKPQSAGG